VVPQKDPAQLETERQDREREIATQTSIVTFTFWLVIVGGLQAAAIIFGLVWTKRAADAAKKTAIVATEALHSPSELMCSSRLKNIWTHRPAFIPPKSIPRRK